MISSSVGSGQYLWGISYKCLPGSENLSGKIIAIKCSHCSSLCFFFSNSDFPPGIFFVLLATFLGQLYIWRSHFFTHFLNNYFDTRVTFSEKLFLQNKLLQSSHFLRIGSPLWQLLYGTDIFQDELFRIMISKKSYFFKAGTFAQYQIFQKSYILEKANY